jgi:hypothetical protein
VNGPIRKKITVIIERGEKGDSQAAVCHGIQKTMARGSQKQIAPNPETAHAQWEAPKSQARDDAGEQRAEKEGMRESPVPSEVTVADAKAKAHDIEVGNNGAKRPRNPHALGDITTIKEGPDAKRGHCV